MFAYGFVREGRSEEALAELEAFLTEADITAALTPEQRRRRVSDARREAIARMGGGVADR